MRNSRLFIIILVVVGGFVGVRPEPAYAGDQQCYRGATDPLYACTVCGSSCLGAGYRCCSISPDPF